MISRSGQYMGLKKMIAQLKIDSYKFSDILTITRYEVARVINRFNPVARYREIKARRWGCDWTPIGCVENPPMVGWQCYRCRYKYKTLRTGQTEYEIPFRVCPELLKDLKNGI